MILAADTQIGAHVRLSAANTMDKKIRLWSACALLFSVALSFPLFVALRLATDEPDDGRVYSQLARNVLEQHVYSHDSQPPYAPSIIRLPGYPLFLAGIYAVFGHGPVLVAALRCVDLDLLATGSDWRMGGVCEIRTRGGGC